MLSLSIILPLLNAQVEQEIEPKPISALGLIGFKQGDETIPINGTTIPLNAKETIWLLALTDISVEYGPVGSNIIRNEKVLAGKEISLTPDSIQCCETSIEYRLKIISQSTLDNIERFEESILLYVGNDEPKIVTPSTSLRSDLIRIKLDGLPQGSPIQMALLKPGSEDSNVTGIYGKVQYQSVIKPQSTLTIFYELPAISDITESTIHFMLISTRTFQSESTESGNLIRMYRDGIVASASVNVNQTTEGIIPVTLNLASLGEPGTGGDTPLQLGLHFLYIHIEGEEVTTREEGQNNEADGIEDIYGEFAQQNTVNKEVFFPIFVMENDEYSLMDLALFSEGGVTLDFTKEIPEKMLVVATPLINGVITSLYSSELQIHLTKITLYDAEQKIYDYSLTFEPNKPSTQAVGVTYILGETLDDITILRGLKVFNFTISNYNVIGENGNEIGFPEILNISTTLNEIEISAINNAGQSLSEGLVKIEKEDEQYSYPATQSRTISIPDGTYKISLIIDEDTVDEKTITITSSQTITLTQNTINTTDIILLGIVFIEIPIAVILGIMIFRNKKYQ